MGIKTLFKEVRQEIAGMIAPELKTGSSGYISGFANLYDMIGGRMQPTDFVAQVQSNVGWVYACASAISESCAKAKLTLHAQKGEDTIKITNHVFLNVMKNVNPFMNSFELQELTEIYQLLTGNAYWYLLKNRLNVPVEIWPVQAQYMTIVPSKTNFIGGYLYRQPGADPISFMADEIVHFKYPNPNNVFYGIGPLMAAAYAVDAEEYMDRYQTGLFKNAGMPDAVLTSDQVVHKSDAIRMREEWKQLYGGVDKAGKIAILGKGLKHQPIQLSAREMAFVQSKAINRDKILGIFRVPKSILGLVEDVNRANAEATFYIFNSINIQPKLIRKEEKINEKIIPLYKQNEGTNLYVQYADPVPENRELEIKERDSRLQTGFSTINEERQRTGLESVDWGDTPIMPLNMAPLGSAPVAPADATGTGGKTIMPEKTTMTYTRARIWSIYKARFDSETYEMRNVMQWLFRKQKKEVLNNLDKYYGKGLMKDASDAIIFIISEWEDKFIEEGGPVLESAYEEGALHGIKVAHLGIDFNIENLPAQEFLKEKKLKFSFETNQTTRSQLRAELGEGLKAGETHKQLAERVTKVFDFSEKYRAMRIARTEVAECENRGIFDTWSKSGKVEKKGWLHGGGGEHPRENHQGINGEEVTIGERFSIGLMYPGDSAQGPGETCNCTCTIYPVV